MLRENCENVYCSYKFFGHSFYRTGSHEHHDDVYFNDINVYLAGLLPKPELHEFIYSSLFEVQVHDRDRKAALDATDSKDHQHKTQTNPSFKPCLFGNDPSIDERISNVNSVTDNL